VGDSPHRRAFERSLALHRAVIERVAKDPRVLERARARVRAWERDGSVAPFYVSAWREVLELAPDRLAAAVLAETEQAHALRQVSPFAGALPARERWQILKRA
jgi:hypothetical protein